MRLSTPSGRSSFATSRREPCTTPIAMQPAIERGHEQRMNRRDREQAVGRERDDEVNRQPRATRAVDVPRRSAVRARRCRENASATSTHSAASGSTASHRLASGTTRVSNHRIKSTIQSVADNAMANPKRQFPSTSASP